jgi:hypothetical protein
MKHHTYFNGLKIKVYETEQLRYRPSQYGYYGASVKQTNNYSINHK